MNTDTTNPKDLLGAAKPQLHLVPPALKIHAAKAMENGAKKFGPYNWRDKKVRMTVYIAAAMRHLESLLDGEDYAFDSDVHHAGHAAACCGIILDAMECKCLIDDRPPKGCAADLIARLTQKNSPPPELNHAPERSAPVKSKCPDCGREFPDSGVCYHGSDVGLISPAYDVWEESEPVYGGPLPTYGA